MGQPSLTNPQLSLPMNSALKIQLFSISAGFCGGIGAMLTLLASVREGMVLEIVFASVLLAASLCLARLSDYERKKLAASDPQPPR